MSTPADQQAVDWLQSFADTERALPRTPAEFNLPRTRALLDLLGSPQARYPSVLIAGTKGKGSTAAMVEAILRAGGLHVGLYTSPHLHTFHERIQVDRRPITPAAVTERVAQLRPLTGRLGRGLGDLSIYEVQTALALAHFAAEQVDVAVLEIGLGGRYDAVNAVDPMLAAISSLSLDHTQILGPKLDIITWHKAGIIRPRVPVVTVPQIPEAAAALARVAAEQGAPLFIADVAGLREGVPGPSPPTPSRGEGEWAQGALRPAPPAPRPYLAPVRAGTVGLPGLFQLENARLASGIALLLRDAGMPLSDVAVAAGLATARWPGRFETLRERPRLIVDGAHNGDSARKLMESLRALTPYRRLILILGASADKDLAAIAAALVPHAHVVILARSAHPRAAAVPALLSAVQPFAAGEVLVAGDIPEALDAANRRAEPDDLICATGSLFIVAAVHEACGRHSD